MEKYGKVWKYTCCATDSRHLFAYFTDYIVMAYGRTGCNILQYLLCDVEDWVFGSSINMKIIWPRLKNEVQ